MKNIKKIMAIILTIAMVCACSTVAFAANLGESEYDIKVVPSKTTVAPGESFTVAVYLVDSTDENADVTFVGGPCGAIELTYTGAPTVTSFGGDFTDEFTQKASSVYMWIEDDSADWVIGKNKPWGTIEVTAGSSDMTFGAFADGIGDTDGNEGTCNDADAVTVTVKAEDPVTPATVTAGTATTKTYVGKTTGNTYNNVWFNTFAAVSNDQIIKSITLKFNGYEKALNIGTKLEGGGTYTFDVAIVGAPAGADVDVDFVAVDAE